MAGRLDGKVAFISGTGRYGIGQLAARLFAAEGARVFGCSPRRDLVVLLDHLGNEVGTVPHLGPPNDPVTPHTSVHRRTLCQILLAGITDIVHFGRTVTGYRPDGDEMVLEFADGGSARGTTVVGADGINSVIRRQLLPEVKVIPLVYHVLLTQAPLTSELAAALLPVPSLGRLISSTHRRSFWTR